MLEIEILEVVHVLVLRSLRMCPSHGLAWPSLAVAGCGTRALEKSPRNRH